MKHRLTTADFLESIRPSHAYGLPSEFPTLASRIEAERGFAIEQVGDLYRMAGGVRWKSSVAETDVSTCARALLLWLSSQQLVIYSRRALAVAGEGNGSVMTRRVLRQLKPTDTIAVVDPAMERGAALLNGDLLPRDGWMWEDWPEPDALDQRIRVANARDASGVAALREEKSSWLQF